MTDQQQEARWHQVGDYICDCADGRHGLQDQAWVGANRVNADEKRIAELADANEALRAENARLRADIANEKKAHLQAQLAINRASAAVETAELRAEALATALEQIKREGGKVCEDFELCTHVACQSSVAAYFIAEAALDAHRAEAPKTA